MRVGIRHTTVPPALVKGKGVEHESNNMGTHYLAVLWKRGRCVCGAHLDECHAEHFTNIPRELVAATYTAAVLERERGQVPQVGWSVDRRTLRRLQVGFGQQHLPSIDLRLLRPSESRRHGRGDCLHICQAVIQCTDPRSGQSKLELGKIHDAICYVGCCDQSFRSTRVDANTASNHLQRDATHLLPRRRPLRTLRRECAATV